MTLTHYLQRLPVAIVAAHEPWPARWEHVLGNLRRSRASVEAPLTAAFTETRRRRIARLDAGCIYVEVNPHLCSLLDVVGRCVRPLHIVHLVREPASWLESITGFGASGWRRHLIDRLPYTRPYPAPLPAGWRQMTAPQKMLWRWRFCNEGIEALRSGASSFATVRFEDLLGADPPTRMTALSAVHRGLSLRVPPDEPLLSRLGPMNARVPQRRSAGADSALVDLVCGDLIRRYGYA